MTDLRMKPITDNSWILHDNGTRLGIISRNDSSYGCIGQIGIRSFSDLSELEKHLGSKITIEEMEVSIEPEAGDIDGYPIKHQASFDVQKDRYPSYTKSEGSTNRFAAGYYGVLFSHGWVYSYCPRTSTLEENEWIGPFRTKLEMQNAITQKKREPRV